MRKLRYLLQFNALSCSGFGATFVFYGKEVADFLGDFPALVVTALGALLLVNAVHLVIAAGRETLWPTEVAYFSAGDLIWVFATVVFIGFGWISTTSGAVASLLTALMVGGFGLGQALLIKGMLKFSGAQLES